MFYLALPLIFLKFWFFEAPTGLIKFFFSLNKTVLHIISLPILVKTYFKPWKNEYRKGLVLFSMCIGVFIKTFVIAADLIIFSLVILAEILLIIAFILWPLALIIYAYYLI